MPIDTWELANSPAPTPERAAAWVIAGVTRISLGVQSFQPSVLGWMHRSHGSDAADRAVQALREAGVTSISVDIIIGVPEVAQPDLSDDLTRLRALDPDHVSVYTLTVEPKTPLGRWAARAQVEPAPDERYAAEFLQVHEALTSAGFEHYEVSNFARLGMRSDHNRAAYERLVFGCQAVTEESEILTGEQLLLERVYLGLRTAGGLRLNELPWPSPAGDEAVEHGWARVVGDRIQLTPEGWLRLDSIASALTIVA